MDEKPDVRFRGDRAGKGLRLRMNQSIFAVKLCELECEYGQLKNRICLCQQEDHDRIRRELQKITEECKENDRLLQETAESSRSPAVAELAGLQLHYTREMEEILKQRLPADMYDGTENPVSYQASRYWRGEQEVMENRAEGMTLYAEYAIDFATQAMKYALQASLAALDMQMSCEEKKEETT